MSCRKCPECNNSSQEYEFDIRISVEAEDKESAKDIAGECLGAIAGIPGVSDWSYKIVEPPPKKKASMIAKAVIIAAFALSLSGCAGTLKFLFDVDPDLKYNNMEKRWEVSK